MNGSRTPEVAALDTVDLKQLHWLACNSDYMEHQQGVYGEASRATARKLRR